MCHASYLLASKNARGSCSRGDVFREGWLIKESKDARFVVFSCLV